MPNLAAQKTVGKVKVRPRKERASRGAACDGLAAGRPVLFDNGVVLVGIRDGRGWIARRKRVGDRLVERRFPDRTLFLRRMTMIGVAHACTVQATRARRRLRAGCSSLSAGASSSIHLCAQSVMALMAAASARPFFVNAYSTRTGVSGTTVRSMMPSSSRTRSRSLSIRSVMSGMASRSVAKRQRDLSSTNTIAPVHRRPINSLAR